jgi:hypothetical protein
MIVRKHVVAVTPNDQIALVAIISTERHRAIITMENRRVFLPCAHNRATPSEPVDQLGVEQEHLQWQRRW